MYLFGGQTDNDVYLGDFFKLDLVTGVWTRIVPAEGVAGASVSPAGGACDIFLTPSPIAPTARHAHASVVHDNSVLIFGGFVHAAAVSTVLPGLT